MALFDSMNNQNQTDVSLIIAKHLLSKEGNGKNLVFSPLSIQVMLGMIAARSDEGPTRDHVLSFLQFKSMDHLNSFASHLVNNVLIDASLEGGPTLRSARSAWVDKYEQKINKENLPSENPQKPKLPYNKISSTFEASSVLQEPGIVLPYLNHTSIIEVNEEGTQAAAEEDDMAFGLFGPPVTDFVADHPFLFMIREDISGTILFIGQVLNPLSE
ncbi:hypothetical protein RIF29_22434 [Crotalaria pallida]|uniref:Serpin domain-containing protein n=1 Tax=Crotalaria pallida TaxID=3830 RepID=A0AAN9F995_CROPI